jgi:hypothetical protein
MRGLGLVRISSLDLVGDSRAKGSSMRIRLGLLIFTLVFTAVMIFVLVAIVFGNHTRPNPLQGGTNPLPTSTLLP